MEMLVSVVMVIVGKGKGREDSIRAVVWKK